jgi:NADPH:quinone reductase-like Zn-dependent oxidoreductase
MAANTSGTPSTEMASTDTMRAWQFATPGSLTKTLRLLDNVPRPAPPVAAGQITVQVLSASLNPADYKVPDMGVLTRAVIALPKVPLMDLSGKVTAVAADVTDVSIGDLVMGRLDPFKSPGALCDTVLLGRNEYVPVPSTSDVDQIAGAPTTALTAYQCIQPYVKAGDKVFINGGSGGLGTSAIQIAKILGCHVTTSCSTAKVSLCKDLGADEIIDYKKEDVVEYLKKGGQQYKLVVDNVGNAASRLYHATRHYMVQDSHYNQVGGEFSPRGMLDLVWAQARPGFLGGGRSRYAFKATAQKREDMEKLAAWIAEGKLKVVIDSVFEFEDAIKAVEKLKEGSSTGKVIVHVNSA